MPSILALRTEAETIISSLGQRHGPPSQELQFAQHSLISAPFRHLQADKNVLRINKLNFSEAARWPKILGRRGIRNCPEHAMQTSNSR